MPKYLLLFVFLNIAFDTKTHIILFELFIEWIKIGSMVGSNWQTFCVYMQLKIFASFWKKKWNTLENKIWEYYFWKWLLCFYAKKWICRYCCHFILNLFPTQQHSIVVYLWWSLYCLCLFWGGIYSNVVSKVQKTFGSKLNEVHIESLSLW